MNPVVAALLFHAPGLRLFAKRRLSPLAFGLNLVALAATAVGMVSAGLHWGFIGVVIAWAIGHTLWSLTLALLIHRGVGLEPPSPQA